MVVAVLLAGCKVEVVWEKDQRRCKALCKDAGAVYDSTRIMEQIEDRQQEMICFCCKPEIIYTVRP